MLLKKMKQLKSALNLPTSTFAKYCNVIILQTVLLNTPLISYLSYPQPKRRIQNPVKHLEWNFL